MRLLPFMLMGLFALTARAAPTACQKADAMWNGKILPSRYAQLPPLASPGLFDLVQLARTSFSIKAFTTEGDELEPGRSKRIHAHGAEARLRWVVNPDSAYTGIFQSGAECIIGRFSLATAPTATTSIPALALKIFITGDQPSLNLHLMHAVDAQQGHNFFAETFSNILPPAQTFATRRLSARFESVAEELGAQDPNPGRLTLEHLAGMSLEGQRIAAPKTPYQLLLKPTIAAQALMRDATAADDFRQKLAGLTIGQAVYDVYTLEAGEAPEKARLLGQLVLASAVVSSRYGDEQLYFQHNMARK